MKKTHANRLARIARMLGYSYGELREKGIEAMLEWIEGRDEKQMPKFLLEIRERQRKLNERNNSKNDF